MARHRSSIVSHRSLSHKHLSHENGENEQTQPRKTWDISECSFQNVGVFQGQHNTIEIQLPGRTLMLSCFTQASLQKT